MSCDTTSTDMPIPPAGRRLPPPAAGGDPLAALLRKAVRRARPGPGRRWLQRLLRDGEHASGGGAARGD